jgi:hypothetical protein
MKQDIRTLAIDLLPAGTKARVQQNLALPKDTAPRPKKHRKLAVVKKAPPRKHRHPIETRCCKCRRPGEGPRIEFDLNARGSLFAPLCCECASFARMLWLNIPSKSPLARKINRTGRCSLCRLEEVDVIVADAPQLVRGYCRRCFGEHVSGVQP